MEGNRKRTFRDVPSVLKEIARKEIRSLYPGYFALVMATGIVSIAAYFSGMPSIARSLFFINKLAYGVLWLLTIVRLIWYRHDLINVLTDHAKGPGFFTMVAGTCILGNQFVIIAGDSTTAVFLLIIGTFLWLFLIYGIFAALLVQENKPTLEGGINGGWLIAVVATQSVSILGTLVAPEFMTWKEALLFSTLILFLLGCMLYILIISMIFYRLTFFYLAPSMFTPLYWVNMGATAITTLAGARLILVSSQWVFLQEILPFLKGFTLVFWATATWWIPVLLILDIWRHLYKHYPLAYDPMYWSLVFPLGMYTTSTLIFAQAAGLPLMYTISHYFIYAALAAWLVTFIGMIHAIIKKTITQNI